MSHRRDHLARVQRMARKPFHWSAHGHGNSGLPAVTARQVASCATVRSRTGSSPRTHTRASATVLDVAAKIRDPAWRRSFLEAIPENAATLALAQIRRE